MVALAAGRTVRHTLRSGALALAFTACATGGTSSSTTAGIPAPTSAVERMPVVRDAAADARWADSVLHTLSLRDKAAQMVWPWILGDYTAQDDPAYRRVERMFREQHLGGLIVSVGSPTETIRPPRCCSRNMRSTRRYAGSSCAV